MFQSLGKNFKYYILQSKTHKQFRCYSIRKTWTSGKKAVLSIVGLLTGGAGVLLYSLDQSVKASEMQLHAPKYAWPHFKFLHSLDHASVRRGYEVYKQVCAACHSLRFVAYRDLVDVSHTEAEAKAEAEEKQVDDGPDDDGNMFKRPGKLSDRIPGPYPNEEAARAANNGSFPPDLSYIVLARHGGENYIFSLLTGYSDAPTGVQLREGQHYNPYFPGGAIAMAQPIFQDSAVLSDGTTAHASQLAKDVAAFLKWTAEPDFDDRQRMLIKMMALLTIFSGLVYYAVRLKFISLKTRQIQFRRPRDSKKTPQD